MKYLSLTISIIAIGISSYVIFNHENSPKVKYIRSAYVIQNFEATESARMKFKNIEGKAKLQIQSLNFEVQDLRVKFFNESSAELKSEIEANIKTINMKQQEIANMLKHEEDQLLDGIMNQVNSELKNYGEEKGLELIIVATDIGNIAYGKDGNDISDDFIQFINGRV